MTNNTVVEYVEVPEELAQELSELLTKQTIRERLLMQNLNDVDAFEKIEALLVPITAKIEALKVKITSQHIPEKYQFERYIWNYEGWEVAQNRIQIIDTNPGV